MNVPENDLLCLHEKDNVGIALRKLTPSDSSAKETIPQAHKMALDDIVDGALIYRYGQVIGQAAAPIAKGAHVHSHNLKMSTRQDHHDFGQNAVPLDAAETARQFNGFHRDTGRVGTRNYLGVLTSVNCAGSVARFIAEAAEKSGMLADFPNVDGIVPIVHGTGCGMASDGAGYALLLRTLAGYAQHPNFGGVLLVGLGCEMMQLASLVGDRRISAHGDMRYMTIQQTGGTRKTIEKGVAELRDLAAIANRAERAPAPVSKLVLGMQCGGSDGYSGFTANPALGAASDLLVRYGGTSILSETPEIYGAEHLLTDRAMTPAVGQALLDKVRWWENYCDSHGASLDNNPSPGNKRGGLTTILEKSLGAVSKSGQAPLAGVYDYAAPITQPGFVFMDSPGYDPCSVTGQIASGANLIAFTTGRGSVSGFMPTPCIKLASNTALYERMEEDMDINCGVIADGVSVQSVGDAVFERLIAVASGQHSKSEALGFGGVEFVPWQIGAVL
ncbi:UxaA family hydrolase [Yoonia sp. SS1-5]|uniref:UxaA family hydrolase n=1 Tax=Yoonia rhodophyticola TaxID=3137370 RepID=A0AAN0MCL8_9RHOB